MYVLKKPWLSMAAPVPLQVLSPRCRPHQVSPSLLPSWEPRSLREEHLRQARGHDFQLSSKEVLAPSAPRGFCGQLGSGPTPSPLWKETKGAGAHPLFPLQAGRLPGTALSAAAQQRGLEEEVFLDTAAATPWRLRLCNLLAGSRAAVPLLWCRCQDSKIQLEHHVSSFLPCSLSKSCS